MTIEQFFEFEIFGFGEYRIKVFHLIMILLVAALTMAIIFFVQKLLRNHEKRGKLERGHAYSIGKIIQYLLWSIAVIIILHTMGIDLTIIMAGSAALLVGLGLGIKQIFSDLISGVVILFEGIIKVGDVVEVSGKVVQVEKINLRTTKVRGRDSIAIIIPNSKFVNEEVINWSHIKDKTRFEFKLSVAYNSNIELVQKLIKEAAMENPSVYKEIEPQVRLYDFGDSGLIFQLMFWGENEFRIEGLKSEIRYSVLEKFRKHNVEIPYPQRVVHIRPEKELSG